MLFFNGPWDFLSEKLCKAHLEPLTRLLQQDFEVISVQGDCDFAAEVDKHRPDIALFCPSFECPNEPSRTIINTGSHPELPRLGYMWRDSFTSTRLRILCDFDRWGVQQIFAPFRKSEVGGMMPNIMYLPYWYDPHQFRDRGLEKEIPVFLFGAGWLGGNVLYPWRGKVGTSLLPKVPCLHAPSLGNTREHKERMVGEECARMLNRSFFSPACGTIGHLLTCKMIEIPASRCCLITQDIKMTRAVGFQDGVNCVMTDGDNVVQRVNELLDDPERLRAITDAGHRLVTERHGAAQRRMFREWYDLWKLRKPSQRIVQDDPFKPLRLAEADEPEPADPHADSPLHEMVLEGYRLLDNGQYDAAMEPFKQAMHFVPYHSEALLGLGICLMHKKQWAEATKPLLHNVGFLKIMNSPVQDPVSIALAAMACIRADRVRDALGLLSLQPNLHHPAVDAAREIARALLPQRAEQPPLNNVDRSGRIDIKTLHLLPLMDFPAWVRYLVSLMGLSLK